jgi:acyl-[acyl carrier protein]--UDP-N-acetylglucosamine O-acyltransferase
MVVNLKAEDQHQHKNGHGWVANTAQVAATVYVGPYALVYGQAEVTGHVRIIDLAQVSGHAKLSGDVVVSGFAWVDGTTKANTGHFHKNERAVVKQERLRGSE